MRTSAFLFSLLSTALLSAGAVSAQAAVGTFYDPSNAASPTGFTTGYQLFRTIGCPGQPLLGTPCPVPKAADRDGDGVVDSDDACPDVPAKTKDGCPAAAPTPAPIADTSAQTMPLKLAAPVNEPAPLLKPLVLEGVNFDYNQATLTAEGRAIIDQNAETLNQWANTRIVISGHTDSRGSDQYNLDLSLRRAMAVRDYLISKGIASNLMITRGLGEAQPVADNNTDEGRSKNRRVELKPLQ